MKKIIIPLLVFVLFGSAVIAAKTEDSQQGQGTGQGQQAQTKTEQQTQNQGEEDQLMIQQRTQLEVQKLNEVKQSAQQRQQEMNQVMQSMGKTEQKVYQNQNQVREAVQTLLSLEDLAPGIGFQVSQIAREFNNSVQATIIAEEKIQKRNAFVRFFMGGEKNAAGEMEQELNQNQQRIQELNQLKEQCACGEEVKTMMQEQIQNMEQEQVRLQQLTEREKNANGVFGWIRNLFRQGR